MDIFKLKLSTGKHWHKIEEERYLGDASLSPTFMECMKEKGKGYSFRIYPYLGEPIDRTVYLGKVIASSVLLPDTIYVLVGTDITPEIGCEFNKRVNEYISNEMYKTYKHMSPET